jgi:predicted kinase
MRTVNRSPVVVLVTGRPGVGKTTVVDAFTQRRPMLVLAKDTIKEALFDSLGAADNSASRQLSDASFATLFSLARQACRARIDFVLEGNFRAREHLAPLRAALADQAVLQVFCCVSEESRRARLAARATESTRHPLHRDAETNAMKQSSVLVSADDRPLQLPGRLLQLGSPQAIGIDVAAACSSIEREFNLLANPA